MRTSPLSPPQRTLIGAEFCVTCQQDCLPIPPLNICGFCDRDPSTGELADRVEALRRRWRENQRRSRANRRAVAA